MVITYVMKNGQRFYRWTVIDANKINRKVLCRCDCGNEKRISDYSLTNGMSKSCGCLQKELLHAKKGIATSNGLTGTRIRSIYDNMVARCYNQNSDSYKYYGELGIRVCKEWLDDIANFHMWAISSGYSDNLSLDRIDNTKDYSPSNCSWKTVKEQNNNKTNNRKVIINNIEKNASQWAEEYGINYSTFMSRLRMGWTGEKLLKGGKHI